MRIMYDSITASNCPDDGQLYAGYVDGRWPNWAEMARRHPGKRIVKVTIWNGDADVLDVEAGDATPQQAVIWCRARRKLGKDPTVYCNLSTWPAVVAAFSLAGDPLPHWWAAGYRIPAIPYLQPGSVATQWADFGPYDQSLVADYWPGVDPPPTPNLPAAPHPPAQRRSPLLWP